MLVAALTLMSCADAFETYNIQGSSMVSTNSDSKMALKVFKGYSLADLDSCDVVHGNFSFEGRIDTTQLGFIVTEGLMSPVPLIIETGGMISVTLERGMNHVSGTPLNDKLYDYLEHYNRLRNYSIAMRAKTIEQARLRSEMDSLETRFIIDNSDNMAGMYVFMQMVSDLMENEMFFTPRLDFIMREASESFRHNPYVINYYQSAKEFMNSQQNATKKAVGIPVVEEATEAK